MNDEDRYRAEILQQQYEDYFRKAQARRHGDGTGREAARYYERAAHALERLAAAKNEDRSDDVEDLRRASALLRRGKDLARFFDDGLDSSRKAADDRESEPVLESDRSGEGDDEIRGRIESFICETDTTWADIGGLEGVKVRLKRAIALGAVDGKPEAVSATDRILLFGPPGTGKTLLASAVAGSLDATFFQVELGNLLSKYYGESSKQISALFDVAEELSPSVLFLDEVDSLTQSRDKELDDTSRRVLDTLLAELDGVVKADDAFVMVLAATNTPWDLDSAIRSRFPQRIHVPLPDVDAATEIVRIHTVHGGVDFAGRPGEFVTDDLDVRDCPDVPSAIARQCVDRGYTGRDIGALCREAIDGMVARHNPALPRLADESIERLQEHDLETGPIVTRDVERAFEATRAALPESEIEDFHEWDAKYGSGNPGDAESRS